MGEFGSAEGGKMIFGKHINRYYLRFGLLLLLGIFALVVVDVAQLEIPEFYGMVVDGLDDGFVTVDGQEVAFTMQFVVDKICFPMLIVIGLLIVGRFSWRVCFFIPGIKVEKDLRSRMFSHCKDLSLQYFHRNKVGNLMSLFTNDLYTVQECFSWGMMMVCDSLFMGTLAIVKMAKMNGWLTLFSLIPMAFMFAISAIVGKQLTIKWDARQQAYSDLSDFAQESFSGIAVIKAYVKEFKELLAFRWINKNNEQTNVAYTKASTLLNICVTLFVESVICIIWGYGGYMVHEGVLKVDQLITFTGYFSSVVWPIMAITELVDMTSRGKASLNRVAELLDAKQDVVDKADAVEATDVQGKVEFKNLTFRFPDTDYDALKDVSFVVNAGERVGIIGKTGCGKTTIADLILRCYNVPDGTLFVDDKDVNDIKIRSLRSFMSYVPQDNYLFSDTIASNIAFASQRATLEEIRSAAKIAGVHNNIEEFHLGYQTVLGERGVTVSGGQKQRISISRAILKNAPILILDDAVSAVDTDTEKIILGNLQKLRQGKTTFVIAHRVSTIQGLDKVVYLDDGKVVDIGTHDELMERCPSYNKMVQLQMLDEAKEDN